MLKKIIKWLLLDVFSKETKSKNDINWIQEWMKGKRYDVFKWGTDQGK
jgi:hypothetical protein